MFFHCAGANRRIWLPQVHRLADAFQVIALDLPGHGALADMPFSLGAAREHVVGVIEAWAGGRALIVGLSLGGYVGVDLAHYIGPVLISYPRLFCSPSSTSPVHHLAGARHHADTKCLPAAHRRW